MTHDLHLPGTFDLVIFHLKFKSLSPPTLNICAFYVCIGISTAKVLSFADHPVCIVRATKVVIQAVDPATLYFLLMMEKYVIKFVERNEL